MLQQDFCVPQGSFTKEKIGITGCHKPPSFNGDFSMRHGQLQGGHHPDGELNQLIPERLRSAPKHTVEFLKTGVGIDIRSRLHGLG